MRVVNDEIQVIETTLTTEDRRAFFMTTPVHDFPYRGFLIVAEWVARLQGKTAAIGWLVGMADPDMVGAYVVVDKEHRGIGLGKFMFSFVTDLAIRARKRTILMEIDPHNERAIALAEFYEFEKDPTSTSMKKVLKWQ